MAEVVAKRAEEAVVGCVNQVKHHYRYMSQYHENMANLEANVKNLEKKKVSVQDDFRACNNAQTIKDGVDAWLEKVKDVTEDAEKLLEKKASVGSGCWKGWFVSMRPRYILSKKAMNKTVDLSTFIEEGVFDTVAHPKRHLGSQIKRTTDEDNIPGDERSENSTAQHPATKEEVIASRIVAAGVDERLKSRTLLLNDVMEAVRDPEIRMVRICGMGGAGKTTMAKQVEQMARKERLFHEIAMVEVGQNPDIKLLQLHIAELFGLMLNEDDVSARAKRLGERLSGTNKKILLILDNVWERFGLEKAGIPLQDANSCCKILLTSRYDDICKGLVHEKEFGVDGLESRTLLLNDVMEAVRDPEIRMVRICGVGGIGKTTLAKQVQKMARKEHLFNEIAMVEVNQNPDLKLLQHYMAQLFGLTITKDHVSAKAMRRERLSVQNYEVSNKKILLILDNVCENIDFEKVGIPLKDATSCCKILLTSRNHICNRLVREKEFCVKDLPNVEAFTLFHQTLFSTGTGDYYDKSIYQDLVKECAGLPISVAAIAGAVKNKTEREWKGVLQNLQKYNIKKDYGTVTKCLRISYDFLESENIQKFFRLCCLFSKGSDVSIEELTRYGTVLGLFNNDPPTPQHICDARAVAFSYVQKLVNSNLFLRSDRVECFKVHDTVWDFATTASFSDSFLVDHTSALTKFPGRNNCEGLCNKLFQVPESSSLSNLKLLRLTGDENACYVESIENFFKEMHGLYVLNITRMTIPSTLTFFQQLNHIRSLSLPGCIFPGDDLSSIGKLRNLEILSFAHSNIKELPIEIKNLKSLRLLDLTMCESCVIAPHVLSGLTSLEELYLRKVPLRDGKGSESVFEDIASMSTTLVVIDIKIPEDRVHRMNSLFTKLKKFKIFVNEEETTYWDEDRSDNRFDIHCDSSILLQPGLTSLLQQATRMELSITQLVTLQPLNDSKTLDFAELKSLKLTNCGDLVCLVNTISDPEHNLVPPFSNLKVLEISGCDKLKHVLTVSAAKSLCILETITVKNCSSLKVIFGKERKDQDNIELSGLKNLFLEDLGNIIGCYDAGDTVNFPRLQKVTLKRLPLITSLLESESEMLASGDNDASRSHPFFRRKEPDTFCRFPNLRSLKLKRCNKLRYISTPLTSNSFGEVQKLKVIECTNFQAIVTTKRRGEGDEEDDRTQVLLLQKLNLLRLMNLKNLSTIVPKGYALKLSSLKTLDVSGI